MTWRRRTVALAVALVVLVAVRSPAWAGQPTVQLQSLIDRVLRVLENPELKQEGRAVERRTEIRKIANEIFDFSETARRSLARHWLARTPAERSEFVELFADLLERSYISRIEQYTDEKIQFVGESVDGTHASVRTKITTKQGSDIPIEYRMLLQGTRWLVYDVVIEGVSLIANYRTQFNKIITTSSYQELVKKMRTKQEEFREEDKQRRTSLR